MPLSLWGIDEARKNFNKRVDDTGSAAWNTARGRKPKDENRDHTGPARRTSASVSPNTSSTPVRDLPPPPRKLSVQDLPPPPKTPGNVYTEAKSRPPPPPPSIPSRQHSLPAAAPPLPRRSTSAVVSSSEETLVRPSKVLNRIPSYPVSIQRNQTQDGVTNELAEKLAKMRTRSQSPGKTLDSTLGLSQPASVSSDTLFPHTTGPSKLKSTVSPKSLSPVSTGTPPKPLSPKPGSTNKPPIPPAPVTATKPGLPPRTTPAPPRIVPLKSSQSVPKPTALPYTPSLLHK